MASERTAAEPATATGPRTVASPGATTVTTLPNLISIGRLLATPVVIWLLLADGAGTDLAAAAVFFVAGVSDLVDGRIARSRNQVGALGVFLDLAADKVLVAGVLVAMVEVALVPAWLAATIVVRELVVQAVRQLAAVESVVISARAMGKAKTLLTLGGMFLLLLAAETGAGPMTDAAVREVVGVAGFWMLVAGMVIAVVSGLAYVRAAWPLLSGRSI